MSASKRSEIKKDILNMMSEEKRKSPIYKTSVDAYMNMWDYKQRLDATAKELSQQPDRGREYLACLAELRQLWKSMITILDWLGISPTKQQEAAEDQEL